MLFNSLEFLIFFPVVVALYLATPDRFRWLVLLTASYLFYMWWKAPFAILIAASTLVDYVVSQKMVLAEGAKRRRLLYISLIFNLGLLAFFKYSQFFATSLTGALEAVSITVNIPATGWQIPVGISFYTLQTLSYAVEVFRRKVDPERHIGIFALYVAFFPQLVAGPIERPQRLMPQLLNPKRFDWTRVVNGLQLMLWGAFKKVVVADQLATSVDFVYTSPDGISGPLVAISAYLFALQIYCDFSGYSDIAIGAARILGIDLMENFARPYFATSIQDFWRRWHISLSTWFRDYLYVPLGGNRKGHARTCLNLMIVFTVSGLWHGPNWSFVTWGAAHGCLLILALSWKRYLPSALSSLPWGPPRLRTLISVFLLVHFVCATWILFRADSMEQAIAFFDTLVHWNAADDTRIPGVQWSQVAFSIVVLMGVDGYLEWAKRSAFDPERVPAVLRSMAMWLLVLWIALYGVFDKQEFIYFKF